MKRRKKLIEVALPRQIGGFVRESDDNFAFTPHHPQQPPLASARSTGTG